MRKQRNGMSPLRIIVKIFCGIFWATLQFEQLPFELETTAFDSLTGSLLQSAFGTVVTAFYRKATSLCCGNVINKTISARQCPYIMRATCCCSCLRTQTSNNVILFVFRLNTIVLSQGTGLAHVNHNPVNHISTLTLSWKNTIVVALAFALVFQSRIQQFLLSNKFSEHRVSAQTQRLVTKNQRLRLKTSWCRPNTQPTCYSQENNTGLMSKKQSIWMSVKNERKINQ